MAFGAANFNPEDFIAIARAEQLAQRQKELAQTVAKACGVEVREEKASQKVKKEKKGKKEKKERKDRRPVWERGADGREDSSSSSSSAAEEEQPAVSTFLGAHGQFALQRRPRSNSPSAKPSDPEAARRAAQELGLRLCRRGRRAAPKPQAAPAASPAAALATLFPKPEETWEAQYAGEGGRAPLMPEEAEAVPREWRRGMASTGHRLGAPPLRRRGPERAAPQPQRPTEDEEDDEEKRGDDEGKNWSHQAFGISQNMWFGVKDAEEAASCGVDPRDANFGVAPITRYRPAPKDAPEMLRPPPASRAAASSSKPAPARAEKPVSRGIGILPLARGPSTGAAGAAWRWEESWDEWDNWEEWKEWKEPPRSAAVAKASADEGRGSGPPPEPQADAEEQSGPPDVAEQAPQGVAEQATQGVAEQAAQPSEQVVASPEVEALEVGDRVRVCGLKTRTEMNGVSGTVIQEREDERWQVAMDDDMGVKIFKAKNLERLPMEEDGPPEVD